MISRAAIRRLAPRYCEGRHVPKPLGAAKRKVFVSFILWIPICGCNLVLSLPTQLPCSGSRRTAYTGMEPKRKLKPGLKKVRTGCVTCRHVPDPPEPDETELTIDRIRRIKCDEQKPNCFRCTSTGRKCDGYQSETVPSQPGRLLHNISLVLPGSRKERRAFEFFCNCTAPDFLGYFPDEFWQRNVLQASLSHSALWHGIVALGSLHEGYNAALQLGTKPITGPDYFTLHQYTKALSNLRKTLSNGSQQTHLALMSCIVFSCFDILTSNIDSAIMHYRSGLEILRSTTSIDIHSYCRIFRRLGLQTSFFLDSSKEEKELDFWEMAIPDPCNDLPKFTSICQARYSFDSIAGSIFYYLHTFPTPKEKEVERTSKAKGIWSSEFLRLYSDHKQLFKHHSLYFYTPDMSRLDSQSPRNTLLVYAKSQMEWAISQHHFLSMLQAWSRKLDAFLLDSNLNLHNRDLQAAAILKIIWLVVIISIEGTITPTKFSTPDFTAKFQKIVTLCKSIAAAENSAKLPQFSMEYGIIGPLHFTALNCNDLGIRRQVLDILSTPRKEGMWDSQVIAYILDRIERGRVPSLNRNDSSTPQPAVTTAKMSNRPLREVIEAAKIEMRMLGDYEPKMRTDTIGTDAEPEFIKWETLVSLEPNIERPFTLQFISES
jgi:hypothetical protein